MTTPPQSNVTSSDTALELFPDRNGNGGFIQDLCFTVWQLCHNPKHEDGNTDWFNDTKPTVMKGIEIIRAALSEPTAPVRDDEIAALRKRAEDAESQVAREVAAKYWAQEALKAAQQPAAVDLAAFQKDLLKGLAKYQEGFSDARVVNTVMEVLNKHLAANGMIKGQYKPDEPNQFGTELYVE